MKAFHAIISGRVQGVGFRFYTQSKAQELGVQGWVRNLDDGRVEVWAQGTSGSLRDLQSWLRVGPKSAQVDELQFMEMDQEEPCMGFEIRSNGGTTR
jgi:acylphosphatase